MMRAGAAMDKPDGSQIETKAPAAKGAAGHAALYSASIILQRCSSIIFFPIFTLYLTKADYGILSITQSTFSLAALFASLELPKALTRLVYDRPEDRDHLAAIAGTLSVTAALAGAALATGLILGGQPLLRPALGSIPFSPYVVWTLAALPFLSVYQVFGASLQATHRARRYVVIDLCFFACNVALNLFFVIVLRMGPLGIILSTFISALVFTAVAWISWWKTVGLRWSAPVLRSALAFSLPLLPFSLLGLSLEAVDRFFLNAKAGVETSGLYYIALTIGAFFSGVKESVGAAFAPWFFGRFASAEPRDLNRVLNALAGGMGVVALLAAWFSYEALSVLSSRRELVEGWRYTPTVVAGLYFVFLAQLVNLPTYYTRTHMRYLVLANLAALIVSLVLCSVLIPRFQAFGAAWAKAGAFAAMGLVMASISRRASPFRFDFGLLALLALGVAAAAHWPLLVTPSLTFTGLKLAVVATLLFVAVPRLRRAFAEG